MRALREHPIFVTLLLLLTLICTTAKPLSARDVGILNTNAKRFAAGLPPLPPARRALGSRTGAARRAEASPVYTSGRVQLKDSQGNVKAYISKDFTTYGAFKTTTDTSNANIFSIGVTPGGSNTQLNVRSVNDAQSRYLAGAESSTNQLSPSAFNVANIALSFATPPGSVSQPGASYGSSVSNSLVETAIWSYSSTTGMLSPKWITSDSSSPTTYVLYDVSRTTAYLTLNPSYGSGSVASYIPVTVYFVPI